MTYLGDFPTAATVDLKFATVAASGVPTTLAGTPAISVYKANGTTESTSGVTLTVDFDSRTGMHHVRVDTSSDGTFYAAGGEFQVVVTAGTVGGTSAVGYVVGSFSLQRSGGVLAYLKAGSTVAASVTGAVGSVTGAVGSVTGAVGSVTGAVGSVTGNVGGNVTGSVGSVATGGIAASSFAAGAIDAAALAADAGTEIGTAVWATTTRLLTAGTNIALAKGVGVTGFNDLSAAQVNAEVDTALADYDAPTNTEMVAAFTEIKGATWATTDTLEAIRDRGDAAWVTATGFATHSAADVWAVATRVLTANTNLNDLSAAGVRSAVGLASANLDTQLDALPTNAELATALGTADDAVLAVLGTPAGASVSADIAAAKVDTAAIKAKTDSLTFTVAGQVDANIQYVNDVAVTGDGQPGTEWGP